MSVVDQDTATEHEARSADTLAAVQAGSLKAAGEQRLQGAGAEWTAAGTCTFATAFIWGNVSADLTFSTGEQMNFYGEHWGLGLGGGTSYGAAVFSMPPAALVGGGTYEVHSVAGVGGFVQVVFFRDGGAVGVFTGAALAVNASVGGGSGTWTLR
ncbi:MAG TPA: hypothetical protein VGB24_13125 [Longimicrobium sp.]|jgi:hypothetical protein|uniref:hypothetical protein n=1 Tax=Longimicrobium sp. TaxID=2029185 RepID=UPI002EDA88B7